MTKPLTPLVDAAALRQAVDLPGYREKRIALRKLVQPVLEQMFSTTEATALLKSSPLVGDGLKQIKVRHQISGLRDQFDLATLTALAYGGTWLPIVEGVGRGLMSSTLELLKGCIVQAISNPSAHAMASTGSTTGYVFGRHLRLTDEFHRTLLANILKHTTTHPTPTKEEPPTMPFPPTRIAALHLPKDTTLDHLMRMLDSVAIRGRINYDTATQVLRSLMATPADADRFEAALELALIRSSTPTTVEDLRPLAADHADIVGKALAIVDGKVVVSAAVEPTLAYRPPSIAEMADKLLGSAKLTLDDVTAEDFILSIDTPTKETTTVTDTITTLPKVDPTVASMIDAMLTSAKLPSLSGLMTRIDTQAHRIKAMMDEHEGLKRQLAEASTAAPMVSTAEASHDGTIPAGKVEWVPAHKAFGLTKGKEAFAFTVPVWTWEGAHPHVPQVDKHYVFRPFELMRVLYGIVANKRVYLHGHTGTGKTTLIEQVAARLGYPFMRLNFDSEISRMDLIGRDTLTSDGGTTVSRFVDGILPQMMQSPCLGCFDEIDFVRPDIAYVMQRMLEGDSLVITEDGGRVVKPHPMFRAFATGNTVGQGDEHGMYQGARVQSTALLDRFSVWQRIDYLKPEDRDVLIRNRVPSLEDGLRAKLNKYIGEHLQAFTTSKVLQPLSPRGFLGLAEAMVFFTGVLPSQKDAVAQALESTILDRASVQDRVVLKGLADRVFG